MPDLPESLYVVRLVEILWGGFLMAISMVIHGLGMLIVLRVNNTIILMLESKKNLFVHMLPVILASCMILFVHLVEVLVWAVFFRLKDTFPNGSTAFYFALNEYTTLGSRFYLPLHWRLLEGMIAITGMLTFAWSTGVLITLAQNFQQHQLELNRERQQKKSPKTF